MFICNFILLIEDFNIVLITETYEWYKCVCAEADVSIHSGE